MNSKVLYAATIGMISGGWIARLIKEKQAKRFLQNIETLAALSQQQPSAYFTYEQLEGLPEPVQRYFRYVLPEQYPYIRQVYLQHQGKFKTGPRRAWTPITAEEYFTTTPPGFIWKGQTHLFTAYDQYIAQRGRLLVRLFNLLKVVDTQGEHINQGELLRWLGESVWFPTSLLPSQHLQWSPLTAHSAMLTFNYQGLTIHYLVYFNEQGEMVRLETERYIDKNRLKPWVGELSHYQYWHGVRIPALIKATWRLSEGDYTYAEFQVKKIDYYPSYHPQEDEVMPAPH